MTRYLVVLSLSILIFNARQSGGQSSMNNAVGPSHGDEGQSSASASSPVIVPSQQARIRAHQERIRKLVEANKNWQLQVTGNPQPGKLPEICTFAQNDGSSQTGSRVRAAFDGVPVRLVIRTLKGQTGIDFSVHGKAADYPCYLVVKDAPLTVALNCLMSSDSRLMLREGDAGIEIWDKKEFAEHLKYEPVLPAPLRHDLAEKEVHAAFARSPLSPVLKAIGRQSGLDFILHGRLADAAQETRVDLITEAQPAGAVLNQLAGQADLVMIESKDIGNLVDVWDLESYLREVVLPEHERRSAWIISEGRLKGVAAEVKPLLSIVGQIEVDETQNLLRLSDLSHVLQKAEESVKKSDPGARPAK